MKKYLFLFLLVLCMFMAGCGKNSNKSIKDDLIKKINDLKGYQLVPN